MLSSILSSLGIRKEAPSNSEISQRTWSEWISSFFGSSSVQDVTAQPSDSPSTQDGVGGTGGSIGLWNSKGAETITIPRKGISLPKSQVLEAAEVALNEIAETYSGASAAVVALRNVIEQTKEVRGFIDFLENQDATIKGFHNVETSAVYASLTEIEKELLKALDSLKTAFKEGKGFTIDKRRFSFSPTLEEIKRGILEVAKKAKANRAEFDKIGRMPTSVGKEAFAQAEQATNRSETELFNARFEAASICQEISTQLIERLHEFSTSSLPSAKADSIGLGAGGAAPTTPDPLADTDHITRTASSWIGLEGSLKDASGIEKQAASWLTRPKKEDPTSPTIHHTAQTSAIVLETASGGSSRAVDPEASLQSHSSQLDPSATKADSMSTQEIVRSQIATVFADHSDLLCLLAAPITESETGLISELWESVLQTIRQPRSSQPQRVLPETPTGERLLTQFPEGTSHVTKIRVLTQFIDLAQQALARARAAFTPKTDNVGLLAELEDAQYIFHEGEAALVRVIQEAEAEKILPTEGLGTWRTVEPASEKEVIALPSEKEVVSRLYDASLVRAEASRSDRVVRAQRLPAANGFQILQDLNNAYSSVEDLGKKTKILNRVLQQMLATANEKVKGLSSDLTSANTTIVPRDRESQLEHAATRTALNNKLDDARQVVLEIRAAIGKL